MLIGVRCEKKVTKALKVLKKSQKGGAV